MNIKNDEAFDSITLGAPSIFKNPSFAAKKIIGYQPNSSANTASSVKVTIGLSVSVPSLSGYMYLKLLINSTLNRKKKP